MFYIFSREAPPDSSPLCLEVVLTRSAAVRVLDQHSSSEFMTNLKSFLPGTVRQSEGAESCILAELDLSGASNKDAGC